jgi:predicted amidohydrolase YtcJ
MTTQADSVYIRGRVYSCDPAFSVAQGIAVKGDRLLWIGTDEQAMKFIGPDTKVFNLAGRTVLPGIVESHAHFLKLGLTLIELDCFRKPKEDILAEVKAAAERANPGEWITGRGWNEQDWKNPVYPSGRELEAAAGDVPVFLFRACGHMAWANGAALFLAGMNRDTPNPAGGEIYRGEDGEATGLLTDAACEIVRRAAPPVSRARQRAAMLAAQKKLFSLGITSIHDMWAGESGWGEVELMDELYREGALEIGLSAYVDADAAGHAYREGPRRGLRGGLFAVSGVKFFADGSLGARSAWLLGDYADRPGHKGNPALGESELYEMVREARRWGFQPATHAIGDAANRMVLDVYERVLAEAPEPKDHRFRIEHAQIIDPDDLARFRELDAIPSMQFVHCASDWRMAESRLGADRLGGAYAWRAMLDMGLSVPGGSDAPVELANPFHGLYAAVSRRDLSGEPRGGWMLEQKLTRAEALRAFTIWGARAAFEEHVRGSLETGKRADFAVLDRDIMTCPEDEIKDASAVAVIAGGRAVYGAV